MKTLRVSKLWNILALVAVVLWLAPAVAWTCPRTGFIGDSPAAVMAQSGHTQCPAMAQAVAKTAERCAMYPEAPGAKPLACPASGKPAAVATETASCCLSAWVPDTRRVAQRASAEQAPAIRAVSNAVVASAVDPVSPASFPAAERVPLQRARAGPSAPRGPPAGVARDEV